MTPELRDKLDKLFETITREMLDADPKLWRNNWVVRLDGCVFRFRVSGWATKKSPHFGALPPLPLEDDDV